MMMMISIGRSESLTQALINRYDSEAEEEDKDQRIRELGKISRIKKKN